jgi:UDP-3-O-acyl-N-acetylglucosamine deacetylase
MPDEPARHKILDLIGDLALLGRPLRAHVIAVGAGHALHVDLARRILRG